MAQHALQRDRDIMALSNPARNRKAEPRTADTALRLGARAVYPIEAREHLLLMLRRNADAIISDLNLHERCLPY